MNAMQSRDEISEEVKVVVRRWLAEHSGNAESLARWMRDQAHIGGMKVCRELIRQSVQQ